jgi:hypothetical protein|tara:strand:+ start:7157 stop:7438 length:282 start_codon:yes stop_codon:yes gene_type:complete
MLEKSFSGIMVMLSGFASALATITLDFDGALKHALGPLGALFITILVAYKLNVYTQKLAKKNEAQQQMLLDQKDIRIRDLKEEIDTLSKKINK